MKKDERIRCPIHDLITFKNDRDEDKMLWRLVQTRPVQRLRRIKQLGFSEFVYPGATHSRFAHSIGAMQMARRMLDTLYKVNKIRRLLDDTDIERRAALAAALLHDIGHGPYSHVFEELSGEFQPHIDHEQYTLNLIDSEEISSILKEFDVYEKTRRFFSGETNDIVFGSVISSQLDCDRLDFLCRDRFQVGIKSNVIDLEWLFDSLTIEKVEIENEEVEGGYNFVFLEKGQNAAEEFVHVYQKMYKNVYFHKTTRGVQHLVVEAIKELVRSDAPGSGDVRLVQYLRSGGDLEFYFSMDDSSVLEALNFAARSDIGRGSELSRRFLCRQPFKAFVVPHADGGAVPRRRLQRFYNALDEENIWYKEDRISEKKYKQYDVTSGLFLKNIIILKGENHVSLGSVSSVFGDPIRVEVRVYFEDHDSIERAAEIWRRVA
jgi:HD superfamily phosphohydrolase